MSSLLNPPASSCRPRVADGHAPPSPLAPASSPRRRAAAAPSATSRAACAAAAGHPQRAIILHPRHAYQLPRPLPAVRCVRAGDAAQAAARGQKPPSLAAALDVDSLACIAARLGDGRSLAAFAATSRGCKLAAYQEPLWRRECERRFGPVAPLPLPSEQQRQQQWQQQQQHLRQQQQQQRQQQQQQQQEQQQEHQRAPASPSPSSPRDPFSWRRLYAFNAAAFEAVVAAAREEARARAMTRLLGGAAAQRWVAGRAAFAN